MLFVSLIFQTKSSPQAENVFDSVFVKCSLKLFDCCLIDRRVSAARCCMGSNLQRALAFPRPHTGDFREGTARSRGVHLHIGLVMHLSSHLSASPADFTSMLGERLRQRDRMIYFLHMINLQRLV